ncbi:MAG: cyclodeaminase [Rhodospirillales bacterium]|nr:cyclodeaminase [Rhodospirillales bacterium]
MPEIKILTEAELRGCVALDGDAVACVEDCFRALATEDIAMPPILRLDIHDNNGEVDVKTAYVPGLDSFAIKISPGFFDNPKLGLPSVNGLMVLFSAKTGLVEAVLLDNGYLTDVRTAAAGAVAAKWLSRADAWRVGIVGAGVQARLQLEALSLVRDPAEVRVWARDPAKAGRFAAQAGEELGLPVEVVDDLGALVAASDIVVTTTPSSEPLIRAEWLRPGLHVTAMGSDAEHKNELAPEVLAAADLYVCDRQSQCAVLGELHHAIEARLVAAETSFPELGQIVAGRKAGRSDDNQITVCDLTGTGVQDTAIATLARARAEAAGAGSTFVS